MNSSSKSNILHLNWSRCVIPILWAAGAVFLLAGLYKTFRAWCQAIHEEHIQPLGQPPGHVVVDNPSLESISRGLASTVVRALPLMQFNGEVKNSSHGSSECAVCLGEFLEGEWLRLLPNCAHVFHVSCIDTWFGSHSSCPLCRTSVLHGSSVGEFHPSTMSMLETLRREDTHQGSLVSHGGANNTSN